MNKDERRPRAMMPRRKGAMQSKVTTPHNALAHQWGSISRVKGRKKRKDKAMTVAERMENTTICRKRAVTSFFQFPEWVDTMVPGA